MTIGELSCETGISVRMLRYYEQEGLLKPRRRTSGYRDYSEDDARIAHRIRKLSESGLKLQAIRILLPCIINDRPDFVPCAEVVATLKREVELLDATIAEMRSSRTVLAGYLAQIA